MNQQNHRFGAYTLIELLVVLGVIGTLAGLTLSGIQRVRQSARRIECGNLLRQSAIGLIQFHDNNRALPPGHRTYLNRDFMPLSGWCLSILPLLEQSDLHQLAMQEYQQRLMPFGAPNTNTNHTALSTVVPVFLCPADSRIRMAQVSKVTQTLAAFTSYLGVGGADRRPKDGLLYQDSRVRFAETS